MNGRHPQQRGVADPVADPGAAQPRPEPLVLGKAVRLQADVVEAGDARVPRAVITDAAVVRTCDEFDLVPGWIARKNDLANSPVLRILCGSTPDRMSGSLKLCRRVIERQRI